MTDTPKSESNWVHGTCVECGGEFLFWKDATGKRCTDCALDRVVYPEPTSSEPYLDLLERHKKLIAEHQRTEAALKHEFETNCKIVASSVSAKVYDELKAKYDELNMETALQYRDLAIKHERALQALDCAVNDCDIDSIIKGRELLEELKELKK